MEIIEKYFPSLTSIQKDRYFRLEELYVQWNKKINVISRKDIGQFILRHVLHSLAIARYIEFRKGTHVLDVGTGGGFPGIPLAIISPIQNLCWSIRSVKK
jgi:16S rRNA (guanine527-N7)-methyltransferase